MMLDLNNAKHILPRFLVTTVLTGGTRPLPVFRSKNCTPSVT
jgi:hypothetical protein